MPTKVPKPDKPPESISPTLWQNVNRRDILSFLDDHSGSYLFYKVMGNDPDPENSRDEEYNRPTHDANAAFGTSVLCTLSGVHSALSAQ